MITALALGLYLDLGVEVHRQSDSFAQSYDKQINNPVGMVEAGYQLDGLSLYLTHRSAINQSDTGYNAVGLKLRIDFNE